MAVLYPDNSICQEVEHVTKKRDASLKICLKKIPYKNDNDLLVYLRGAIFRVAIFI